MLKSSFNVNVHVIYNVAISTNHIFFCPRDTLLMELTHAVSVDQSMCNPQVILDGKQ